MRRWFFYVGSVVCTGVVALSACRTEGSAEGDLASPPLHEQGIGGMPKADAGSVLVGGAGGTVTGAGGAGLVMGAGGTGLVTGAGGTGLVTGAGGTGLVTGTGGSSSVAGSGGSGPVTGTGGIGPVTGTGGSSSVTGSGGSGPVTGTGGSSSVTGAGGAGGRDAGPPVKLGQGSPCSAGTDCMSSNCIDGVCCDTPCGGVCQACSAAKKGSGVDGACGPLKAGSDPDDECPAQPASSCGTTGDCNGQGACRKHSNGTVCDAATCVDGLQSNVDLCDGNGACVDGGTMVCGALGCEGPLCKSPCGSDADCPPTAYCDGKFCVLKLSLGSPCTAAAASHCGTGFCAEGVCCDAACDSSTCVTCKQAGGAPMDGTCTARNGSACDDQNPATPCDLCVAGLCQGTPAPSDTCQAVVYSSFRMACTVYSKLDGLPCGSGGDKGICIAGSCLLSSSKDGGAPGSGGASAGQGGSSQGGHGGTGAPNGAGGDATYGLQGGGCSASPSPSRSAPWLLLGLFLAARRSSRSRRVRAPR